MKKLSIFGFLASALALSGCGGGQTSTNPSSKESSTGIESSEESLSSEESSEESSSEEISQSDSNSSEEEQGPTWNTIQYGIYPQTIVTDSALIDALNALPDSLTQEFVWYPHNGEYYAKQVAAPGRSEYTFGNGAAIVEGATYWFKCEPIVWDVLHTAEGKNLAQSSLILDTHAYYDYASHGLSWAETRNIGGVSVYHNNYKYSDIRAWLNQEFYSSAFAFENERVLRTEVDNLDYDIDQSGDEPREAINEYSCENTNDMVFMLSRRDLENEDYGYVRPMGLVPSVWACQMTDYAKAKGAYCHGAWEADYDEQCLDNGEFWTRTPSDDSSSGVFFVNHRGYYRYGFENTGDALGVRPAITLQAA